MLRSPLLRYATVSPAFRLVLAAVVLGASGVAPAAVALTSCRLAHPAGLGSVPAQCTTIPVPVDPAQPQGATLALSVAVVPALDPGHRLAPLFIVAGGPGQGAQDFYAMTTGAWSAVHPTRDLVLVDTRGTGHSGALACPGLATLEDSADTQALAAASARCHAEQRVDTTLYTTSVTAQDLDRVRAALGYPAITLYGISYGTRVVQHYARRFPSRVEAMVLDGVLPPTIALGVDTPQQAQRALDAVFERCEAQPACRTAFPALKSRYAAFASRLSRQPLAVPLADPAGGPTETLVLDEAALSGVVRLLNYSTSSTALLPLILSRAADGHPEVLARQLALIGEQIDAQVAVGLNAAVTCTEDVPAFAHLDPATVAGTYLGDRQWRQLTALCTGWPAGRRDADFHEPLQSSIPTLLLSGEWDPVTPPSYAREAARGLSRALAVVVPGQGHGQLGVACATVVVAEFLERRDPERVDVSCLQRAQAAPFFLNLNSPGP